MNFGTDLHPKEARKLKNRGTRRRNKNTGAEQTHNSPKCASLKASQRILAGTLQYRFATREKRRAEMKRKGTKKKE
jgi:hypothetical protein